MLKIAHIVNPFKAPDNSDLLPAQTITFESMLHAKNRASSKVDVDLLAAVFEEDLYEVPKEFRVTKFLNQSVLNFGFFSKQVKLPLIYDILERLFNESDAEYLIYTNVDIGLYDDFYLKVREFISLGHDAFIINRRRLSSDYLSSGDLNTIYKDKGKKHPGFDCFVFHRSLFPQMQLAAVCIGVPFIEITLSQNLFALAKNFKLFENEILTFHLGMEIYKRRAPMEYFWYNRKEFHKAEKELWPKMSFKKFPYGDKTFVWTLLKWMAHPCIPTRVVIKLLFKGR